MIIKIIPETEAEKAKIQEAEHYNVREFLIFGNKKDGDGELVDFHDWSGSYRYLLGSIYYFSNFIADEQNSKQNRGPEIQLQPKVMASSPQQSKFEPKFVKKGETEGPLQVVELDAGNIRKSPSLRLAGEDEVKENDKDDKDTEKEPENTEK